MAPILLPLAVAVLSKAKVVGGMDLADPLQADETSSSN
jgi:hypothetical protein